jgi:hypothetical protein
MMLRRGRRRGRGYAATAAVVGAGLALFAASRTWTTAGVPGTGARTGGDLLPWLPALGLAALAGAGALLATAGVARMVVGGLLVLCGLGIAGGAAAQAVDGAVPWWPVLAAVGGLLVLDAGVLTLRKGRSWPALGARYQRDQPDQPDQPDEPDQRDAAAVGAEVRMWDALDRGEDPTRE